jgi:DNA gyrase subunit B
MNGLVLPIRSRYDGGIVEYVKYLNEKKEALHEDPIYVEGSRDMIRG